jgi:hypothetical protein
MAGTMANPGERQPHDELGSLAGALAQGRHRAAVKIHQSLDQGQPQLKRPRKFAMCTNHILR